MAIPTPEERANGVFICVRDADTRRNIAAAILLDRRAVLAVIDDVIEAMAEAIAMADTSHFGDDTPYAQQPQMTRAMRCLEARAALATLRWAWGPKSNADPDADG